MARTISTSIKGPLVLSNGVLGLFSDNPLTITSTGGLRPLK